MTQDEIQAVALKPCPFCGNDGSGPIEHALHVSHTQNDWHSAYDCYSVQCDKCTVSMGYSDNEAEAIAAWNTRADAAPTPKADEVETVAQAIEDQLTAEDGWMVGTPALSSMCRDFALVAIAALDAARGDPVARVVAYLRETAEIHKANAGGKKGESYHHMRACTWAAEAIERGEPFNG